MRHRSQSQNFDAAAKPGDVMSEPAIKVRSLVKLFDKVIAVNNIDFTVERGSVSALLGGNGAGKTTILAVLLGLIVPTRGSVSILGENMLRHPEKVLPFMNFESPYLGLPKRLTVRQNLKVYARLYGLTAVDARIAELSADLDLGAFIDRPVGTLSAGQSTRAGLAKALINEPELLLLDEPTASLDPDTADWVRGYFENYRRRRGATLLLASHNMGEVERLCDHVFMMRAGTIVDEGTPAELIRRYGRRNLEEVFLDIARGREQLTGAELQRGKSAP
jgi:ABC-2 type transport system ATP-binding protein